MLHIQETNFTQCLSATIWYCELPLLADGEDETPYAIGIDPRTQDVWIAANMSDRILRFNPREEIFAAYPSPTQVNKWIHVMLMIDCAKSLNFNLWWITLDEGFKWKQ